MTTEDHNSTDCLSCGHPNSTSSHFCISCGAPLPRTTVPQLAQSSPFGQPDVATLQQEVAALTSRVYTLEAHLGISPAPAPLTIPSPSMSTTAQVLIGSREVVRATEAGQLAGSGQPAGQPSRYLPSSSRFSNIDWETVMGRNWFAIIGTIALAVGAAFFLSLAFENDWIGETGRVLLGLVGGFILLAAGEYSARRIPRWSQPVTSGGISILYLSIYASFGFYELISPVAALGFLLLVVAISGLLAIRYESTTIALMTIVGAFATPVFLGRDMGDQLFALLGYLLIVDLGILGVATFRNWRWFTLIGMLATYVLLASWIDIIPNDQLLFGQAGISAVFLIFVGATMLFHIVWRRPPKPFDMALMTINAVAYYGMSFGLLWAEYEVWFGLFSLILGAFYAVVGYASIKRSGAPPEVALYSVATALLFITIAVPLQLTGGWITVGWAVEGSILVWVGFTVASDRVRIFALGVFAIAIFRLLALDTFFMNTREFDIFVNDRFPIFVVGIASMYVATYLYRRHHLTASDWERNIDAVLAIGANMLTVWILTAEIFNYYERQMLEANVSQVSEAARSAQVSAITVTWAVYAIGLVTVGFGRRMVVVRWLGLALIALVAAKFVLYDTAALPEPRATLLLVANFYFLSAIAVFIMAAYAAVMAARHHAELLPGERHIFTALVVLINVVALWGLSVESWHYLSGVEQGGSENLQSAKHLTLTILWTVYAIGLIIAGIIRRSRTLRLSGIALILLPIAKLFAFDVFLLEQGYRVAAFISLGVMLLALGLAYQRYSEVFRGFFMDDPTERVIQAGEETNA